MMEYNDYELVELAQEHNEDAINILHDKYKPLITKKSKEAYRFLVNKGVELSDVIQEATIGFEEAINDFNQNDGVLFYTFVNICIDRQIKTILIKFNRNKYKFLNEAISFDFFDEDGENKSILDYISKEDDNPEFDLISDESFQELYDSIMLELSDIEKQVFELRVDGYNYQEISKMVSKDMKSIDNTLRRIKAKIKKMLEDEDKDI